MATRDFLEDHLEFHKAVSDATFDYKGHTFGLDDICFSANPYMFQCFRFSVLDCFHEGGDDLPLINSAAVATAARAGIIAQVSADASQVAGIAQAACASSRAVALGYPGYMANVTAGVQNDKWDACLLFMQSTGKGAAVSGFVDLGCPIPDSMGGGFGCKDERFVSTASPMTPVVKSQLPMTLQVRAIMSQ